ncbi:hypothetical protein BN903_33 [Halorubrum sp. AJ67]|nr:hypothetical protein BN903_33 [Halorubrum sp. AJ67]
MAVQLGGGLERLHLVGADRVREEIRDVGVVDHRRQHLRVAVREDVTVVARVAEPADALAHVVEHLQLVVHREDLVALRGREVDAVRRQRVRQRVPVHLEKGLVGVDRVRDERVRQRPRPPQPRHRLGVGNAVRERRLGGLHVHERAVRVEGYGRHALGVERHMRTNSRRRNKRRDDGRTDAGDRGTDANTGRADRGFISVERHSSTL